MRLSSEFLCLCLTLLAGLSYARRDVTREIRERKLEAAKRLSSAKSHFQARQTSSGVKNITFSNPKASGPYL